MPVIPSDNFNQNISLSTSVKEINPSSLGIVGKAASQIGDIGVNIATDIHDRLQKSEASEFAFKEVTDFKLNSDAFIQDLKFKQKSDGTIPKGTRLLDGSISESENQHELIQKYQDDHISKVEMRSPTQLSQQAFLNYAKPIATSNVVRSQGDQFETKIKYIDTSMVKNIGLRSNMARDLGRSVKADSLDLVLENHFETYQYIDDQVKSGAISPKKAEEYKSQYSALSFDSYFSGAMETLNSSIPDEQKAVILGNLKSLMTSGAYKATAFSETGMSNLVPASDREISPERFEDMSKADKAQYSFNQATNKYELNFDKFTTGNKLLNEFNKSINPGEMKSYRDQLASYERSQRIVQAKNAENNADDTMAYMLKTGENPNNLSAKIGELSRSGLPPEKVLLKSKEILQVAAANEVAKVIYTTPPSKRKGARESALTGTDKIMGEFAKELNIKAEDPTFGGAFRAKVLTLTEKADASARDLQEKDPAAYNLKYFGDNPKYMLNGDLARFSNPNLDPDLRRKSLDSFISKQNRLNTYMESKNRRVLPKSMVSKFSNDLASMSGATTVGQLESFQNNIRNSMSPTALNQMLSQAHKDNPKNFSSLNAMPFRFTDSNAALEAAQLVARQKDINSQFKEKFKDKDLKPNLVVANKDLFSAMKGRFLGVGDSALEKSMTDYAKLYMQEKMNSGLSEEDSLVAYQDHISKNWKPVVGKTGNLLVTPDMEESAKQFLDENSSMQKIEKLLQENKAPLPGDIKNYFEYSSSIYNAGGFVGNDSSSGVQIIYKTKSGNKVPVLGPDGKPLEFMYEKMKTNGAHTKPQIDMPDYTYGAAEL